MRDRSKYPPWWKQLSRYVRFERAGGRCEVCGARHNLPHPERPDLITVLQAAHVDHAAGHHPDNLICVCAPCHMKLDGMRHAQSRRYGRRHWENQHDLFEPEEPEP